MIWTVEQLHFALSCKNSMCFAGFNTTVRTQKTLISSLARITRAHKFRSISFTRWWIFAFQVLLETKSFRTDFVNWFSTWIYFIWQGSSSKTVTNPAWTSFILLHCNYVVVHTECVICKCTWARAQVDNQVTRLHPVIWVDNFSKIYSNPFFSISAGPYCDANYTTVAFMFHPEQIPDMNLHFLALVSSFMLQERFRVRCATQFKQFDDY